ncbi:hypothetical protein C772_02272 [Bhargavaea cecembensis DSE10]|uniref:Uncharacterized protein n=2 Tax=Bhargavaea cecembensis TaxID=394098 RepID=M7P5I9_9BACL|nr:hypothetical protein C772_02272 [Bhargavaea cecembensis DSE10]
MFIIIMFSACSPDSEEGKLSADQKVAIQDALKDIVLIDYLPIAVTRNEYKGFNLLEGEQPQRVTEMMSVDIVKASLGKNNVTERTMESTVYTKTDEGPYTPFWQAVTSYIVTTDIITDSYGSVYLKHSPSWESDGYIYKVTGIEETIEVEAGVFENCLIVNYFSQIDGSRIGESVYAPKVGLIKSTIFPPDRESMVLKELTKTETTEHASVDYRLLEEMRGTTTSASTGALDEAEPVEDNLDEEDLVYSDETEEESLVDETFKDQSITETNLWGKVSSLYLADYTERVNDMARDQLDTALFHNPAYEETLNGGIYSFPVMTYASPSVMNLS